MKIYHSTRDDVVGTVKINGVQIGYVKSVSPSFDNDPQEFPTLDSRGIKKFTGALKVSMKIDAKHHVWINTDLYSLALGKKIGEDFEAYNTGSLKGQTDETKLTVWDESVGATQVVVKTDVVYSGAKSC